MQTGQSGIKRGMNWVIHSVSVFRKTPATWMLLSLGYVILFMVIPAMPAMPTLLKLLIILAWPYCLAVAIGMFRQADQNRDVEFGELALQIRPNLAKLVALGGVCLIYGILVSIFTQRDMQVFAELANATPPSEALLTQALPLVTKLLLLLLPMMMATWFSPMLVAYNNYSVVNAIKSSIAGCLQYVIPLTVAWLFLTVTIAFGMMLIGVLVALVTMLSKVLGGLLMMLSLVGCLLLATALMLAFQYVCYRDIYKL